MSSFGDFISLSDVCDVPTAKIISREVLNLYTATVTTMFESLLLVFKDFSSDVDRFWHCES